MKPDPPGPSCRPWLATLIAVDMHAGADIALMYPLFPDAITVAMFARAIDR